MTFAFRSSATASTGASTGARDGTPCRTATVVTGRPPVQSPAQPPVHDARRLTGTGQTGYIMLDDKTYVLRITRAGKLILTK